ncbi:MAG: TolB family protein [Phycisphaerales bacterium]
MLVMPMVAGSVAVAADEGSAPKPAAAEAPVLIDWRSGEAGVLSNHVQLTFPEQFVKAGEAYFNGAGSWIVFQATPRAKEGETQSDVYAMYVAKVKFDGRAGGVRNIVGIDTPIRVSPEGSANTCGFFNPGKPMEVIFGSTLVAPSAGPTPGYQRGTRSYRWAFPKEMDIVRVNVPAILAMSIGSTPGNVGVNVGKPSEPVKVVSGPGYDAECAFDPSGRYIVYATQKGMDEETQRPKIALELFDSDTGGSTELTKPEGYNGGPFFSDCGTMICMRADRKGDDLLQVYVLHLNRGPDGAILGVKGEYRVTENEHVNWGPYFHPSGEYLVYASSEVGHDNYEVFAVEVPRESNGFARPSELKKKRVTHASGFDGLPVFSPEGEWMMWTSQRGAKMEGEARASSQLWVGKVGGGVRPGGAK